jgi:hypothetical protein
VTFAKNITKKPKCIMGGNGKEGNCKGNLKSEVK